MASERGFVRSLGNTYACESAKRAEEEEETVKRWTIPRYRWLAAAAALLVACSAGIGSIPGVFTTGDIRILGLDPDVRECVVTEGIWLVVLGENLGDEAAWASGENTVTFPPNPPGIESEQVQLVGNSLFMLVPAGVTTGNVTIDAGDQGVAEIPITVEGSGATAISPNMVGTICTSNPPSGS